jgi:serine protease Do
MRIRIHTLWLGACLVGGLAPFAGIATSTSFATEARETPLVKAVKKAKIAVVNIHSEKFAQDKEGGYQATPPRKINGMGTGIVLDERGYIVTNQHVVADVESLTCTLHDGSTYSARVISYDKKHDLAIIKVNASRPLQTMPLGTSSDLMLGETVIAIGNAFGYTDTVTAGIISSLSRDVEVNEHQSYKNLIQTDASINPGNSGGPLINLDGEVVGINVAIRAGAQRIGFTIPIDDARRYIARLLNVEKLGDTYHGVVSHDEKRPGEFKMIIDSVEPNSPAAMADLRTGDIVSKVADIEVQDGADFERAILGRTAGEAVDVRVRREGQDVALKLAVGKAPADLAKARGLVAPAVGRAQNEETADEVAWRVLGLKVGRSPAPGMTISGRQYRGGLRIVEVRAESPAARHGIQSGDVLVGLHDFETLKVGDVQYVLNQARTASTDPLRFFVVRGQQALEGNLRIATNSR